MTCMVEQAFTIQVAVATRRHVDCRIDDGAVQVDAAIVAQGLEIEPPLGERPLPDNLWRFSE